MLLFNVKNLHHLIFIVIELLKRRALILKVTFLEEKLVAGRKAI